VFYDEPNDFVIDADLSADLAHVHVTGELDISSAPRLITALHEAAQPPVRRIDLDCRGVSFLDSTGLRALLVARNEATRMGVDLVLVDPSPSVSRVIQMTGLASLLTGPDPA
jgi:anti-sigma B factor antagonist